MLTPEQLKAREGKLTASCVGILLSGKIDKITALWRELIGDPGYERENLDGVWPVQLGSATEALNLAWYERKTGHSVTRRGEVVTHPTIPWAAATLDGWDSVEGVPIECKHVGGFEHVQVIIDRYHPQCTWQMMVTGADRCVLSVIMGAKEPVRYQRRYSETFAAELLAAGEKFMTCVRTLTQPQIGENE